MTSNKFIAQTFRDLLNLYNIDSYRPKYANIHVILEEIKHVCADIEFGKVKESYLKKLIEEARHIIQKDEILKSDKKSLASHLLHILNNYENPTFLKQSMEIQLNYFRNDYFDDLKSNILKKCDRRTSSVLSLEEENKIINLVNSFVSECIYNGISFKYLTKMTSLEDDFSKTKVTKIFKKFSGKSKFNLYLRLNNVDEQIVEFYVKAIGKKGRIKVSKKWPIPATSLPNYLKIDRHAQGRTLIFYTNRIPHKDKYSALFHFRSQLEYIINLSHVLSPVRHLKFFHKGLVYDYSEQKYGGVDYEHIVDYKKKRDYKNFEEKLIQCTAINDKIRTKIETSVSYLDTSLNEFKLINKYLNSWISLEVLFNGISQEERSTNYSTADYIQKYLPSVSTIWYIKKILDHILKRIIDLNIKDEYRNIFLDKDEKIQTVSFLIYLKNRSKFDQLLKDLKNQRELANKLENLYNTLTDNKKLKKFLERHNERIEQHLKRLYRVRNDIVHGGEQIINSRGLFNSTSIEMLSINCQEYTTDLIDKFSEFCFKQRTQNNQDIERMVDVCEAFNALYYSIVAKLSKDIFSEHELKNLLEPHSFFFKK